jgi:uncharacterized protein (UPF0332 family)
LTPETADLLATARQHLAGSRSVMALELWYIAAREAYLAAFHAAEALIFQRTGKIAKTHSGLRSQFALLSRTEPQIDASLTKFLADAYELKSVADYGASPATVIRAEDARSAIEAAARFVDAVDALLA